MLEKVAEATEKAYWFGISDGKAGNPQQVDPRFDIKRKRGSELSRSVCEFMLKAYTAGYELGEAERSMFGKEVNKE